jgi:phosphoheptose isomerase
MIYTASEILSKIYSEDGMDGDLQLAITLNPSKELIIKAINEARKQAIRECAGKAKIMQVGSKRTSVLTGSNFNSVMAHIPVYEVDKQSILSLLDQIK